MISFRKIEINDLMFINEVRNDCAFEFLHDSRKFTIDETISWFEKTNPDFYVILNGDKKIGYFRLSNYSNINRNIYVGADLHSDFRGVGLAFEAYKLFIPFLFSKYNLHKVSLEVLKTNLKAIKLYERLGFKYDGVKREEVLKGDKWVDSIIMSIVE